MSGYLEERAHLQKQLAENFDNEARQLHVKLAEGLRPYCAQPDQAAAALQERAVETSCQDLVAHLMQNYGMNGDTARQISHNATALVEAEHSLFTARDNLRTTTQRRKQRRRQKQ